MSRGATLLYDSDCGFCRWSVATVLRRDAHGRLRPAAIQSAGAAQMLAAVPESERLRSWHLVLEDGRLYSGGKVFVPLLELLGQRRLSSLLARAPRLTKFSYQLVADRRGALSPLIPSAAKLQADELIRTRARSGTGAAPTAGAGPISGPIPTGWAAPRVGSFPAPGPTPRPAPAMAPGPFPAPVPVPATGLDPPAPDEAMVDAGALADAKPRRVPVAVAEASEHEAASELEPAVEAEPEAEHRPRSWQQHFEESAAGRGILSTLFVVTLIAIVAINLPESDLRRQLLRPGQPYLNAIGVDQNWALFAPDPRRVVIDVSASVTYDDGSTAVWSFPHDGALVGTYRDYRWRKWEENLINPANGRALWRSAALWAASSEARPGHSTTSVALTERYAPLAAPGVSPSTGPTGQRVFYVLRLRPGGATQ